MIGKLKGLVESLDEESVVLDVQGVGYVVHCGLRTLQSLPAVGEASVLFVETHVREDMIRLYGFRSDQERNWFRLLQSVQGVGAKVALGILSVLEMGALATAIGAGDKAAIARAPGVGPKLASRLILEMKEKAAFLSLASFAGGSKDGNALIISDEMSQDAKDAISALTHLGYGRSQAVTAITMVLSKTESVVDTRILIRLGLKELAQS